MLPRDVSALLERLEDRALLSTINWDGGASGTGTVWSTAANWVGDVLPVSGDDAVIDATFSAVTITSSANATVTVNSVTSDAALAISAGTFTASTAMSINNSLALSGGTLDVTGNTSVTGAFNLSGGTLRHTTVTTTPLLNVANSPTLDGVTLAVNTTLLPGTSGSGNQVTVLNSLTLTNVLLRLDRPYDFDGNFNDSNALDVGLNFSGGTQTLGGTGMVELSNGLVNNNVNDVRVRPTGGGTLTIAAGIAIRNTTNSKLTALGDTAGGALTLQGTVLAQSSGQTLQISGSTVTNSGTLRAIGGGTLQLPAAPTNFSSGTLTGGTWQAASGGTLRVTLASSITTNAATILLDGATSNFYRDSGTTKTLAGLTTNTGSLTLANGHVLVTTSDIANQGTLVIDTTSKLQTGLANQVSLWSAEGNANDSVAGNNGTAQGGLTFVTGRVGQAFNLDGIDDRVTVPNLDRNTFTFATWVKRDRISVPGYNDRLLVSVNSFGWGVFFDTNNTIGLRSSIKTHQFGSSKSVGNQ